jgi:uncharacterized protein (DUF1778 family)
MTPELYAALVAVGIASLSALGVFIRYVTQELLRRLDENTSLTRMVERQTNGELAKARSQAHQALAAYQRIKAEQRDQKWLIAQLQRTGEGRAMIDRLMQARRTAAYESEELIAKLLEEANRDAD